MVDNIFSLIAGAMGGFVIGIFTVRFSYKQLFAQTVSQNRMDWINHFREEFATIIAVLTTRPISAAPDKENTFACAFDEKYEDDKRKYEGNKARAKLLTRLNQNTSRPGNEYNEVLADMLMGLDFDEYIPFSDERIKLLISVARKILEPEWQKVKREARGKEGN